MFSSKSSGWALFGLLLLSVAASLRARDERDDGGTVAAQRSFYVGDDVPAPLDLGNAASIAPMGVSTVADFCRTGCPQCVRRLALPSNNNRYGGYYVGGGLPVFGEGRCPTHDGTWGWDYCGLLFPKRVALNWSRNARYQGGTGAYKSDGPKLRHE